jgi:hypothetical protein
MIAATMIARTRSLGIAADEHTSAMKAETRPVYATPWAGPSPIGAPLVMVATDQRHTTTAVGGNRCVNLPTPAKEKAAER